MARAISGEKIQRRSSPQLRPTLQIQQHCAEVFALQRTLAAKTQDQRRRLSPTQDAKLGIAGMRIDEEHAAAAALAGKGESKEEKAFRTSCSDVNADHDNVERLFNAMMAAKKKSGEAGSKRHLRFLQGFRPEEDRADPQRLRMPRR